MAKMTEIHKKYACFRKLNCEKCLKIKGKCVRLFLSIYGIEIYQNKQNIVLFCGMNEKYDIAMPMLWSVGMWKSNIMLTFKIGG